MTQIESWLQEQIGLDPASVGPELVARAIQRRLSELAIQDKGDYLALLHSSESERQHLIEAAVVPETWFFRDQGPFNFLKTWVKTQKPSRTLRIASVPCSHGEEPYSIAMTLLEAGLKPSDFRIDAFDVSLHALQLAKTGVYRPNSFRNEIPNRERYFEPVAGGMEIRQPYRSYVNFEWGNLLDPSFGQGREDYQIIFCRNLLIYLDAASRKRAVETLDRMLDPDGILFVGAVETLQSISNQFESIREPQAFAFRRKKKRGPNTLVESPMKQAKLMQAARPIEDRYGLHRSRMQRIHAMDERPPALSLDDARQLSDQGRLPEALAIVETIVRNEKPNADAFYLLGLIQQAMNEFSAADEAYQKALFLQPEHESALAQLALLRDQCGDPVRAERFRRRLRRVKDVQDSMKETTV
ncbi:hypothetical protein K8I31_15355 [bacterium]|nr:hypothetical protein [bacterium]